MSEMMNFGHGFGMGGMWFLPILFWIFILVGIFLVVKGLLDLKRGPASGTSTNNDSPITILRKRFATGEIDEETYKKMKQELEG